MCTQHVDFGFSDASLPVGSHVCQIYDDENERTESLLKFITSGLQNGECSTCFSEDVTRKEVGAYLKSHGLDIAQAEATGSFTLSKTSEVYFHDGEFVPERMLDLLRKYHEHSVAKGFTAARVIGEMSSDVLDAPGGSRLLEYECRVSMMLRDHPVTAVCQYDASEFDGATIMDILKVHPMMIARGAIIMNPFYVPPEDFLKGLEDKNGN